MLLWATAALLLSSTNGALLEQANGLLVVHRFAEAKALAASVLATEPDNATALKIKGNAEYFLSDFEQSISTLITLLERHPEDADGAYMLGRIYYQEAHLDQAIGQFERAVRLDPTAYKAWDNLGLCWEAKGDMRKATAHFLKAIDLVEKDHPDYDLEHAFAAAAKAANRNPQSARNFYIGAKALEKLGKTDLCINWLQRSVALDANYSEPEYLLARVYAKVGETEKAEAARQRFLEIKAHEPGKRR
jgi:tetratricopeptide (TPR) repeat protein